MESTQPAKYLILDTNITQPLGSEPLERSKSIGQILSRYSTNGYNPAISTAVLYESIQRCDENKEKEVIKKLELFTQLEVSKEVLMFSAWLADFYRAEDIPETQISMCDKVIAATAALTGSLIMTTNGSDYPRPFFSEKEKIKIEFKFKNKDQLMIIYILESDYNVLQSHFGQRFKSLK